MNSSLVGSFWKLPQASSPHLSEKMPKAMAPTSCPVMYMDWAMDFSDLCSHTRSHWGKEREVSAGGSCSLTMWLPENPKSCLVTSYTLTVPQLALKPITLTS